MTRSPRTARNFSFVVLVFIILRPMFIPAALGQQFHDKFVLQPLSYHEIPGWEQDATNEALATFLNSCQAFAKMKATVVIGRGALSKPAAAWQDLCRRAASIGTLDSVAARKFFETCFLPFRATDNGNSGAFFTGYYQPVLKGSLRKQEPYVYPVYGLPAPGTPPYTRAQIDQGKLDGHAPVLAYVDDPIKRFFLHVQGTGRIDLDTGEKIYVSYAGRNGFEYVSIGKVLVEEGVFRKDDVTMPILRQWLSSHPSEMWHVMWKNPSYIFFRRIAGTPVGTEQVPLTAARSLAIDPNFVPLGMPVFVDTMLPATSHASARIFRQLLIAQDTGSAIRGPVRGDIFFGLGDEAEELAGSMEAPGQMIVLLPRPLAPDVGAVSPEALDKRGRQ